MCKKLCLAVGAVIVGLVVITFTGLGTLAQVKWHQAQQWMDSKVSPETKLQELKAEQIKIDKDIKKHLGTLAAMEVDYERLDANLTAKKEAQAKLREDIAAMNKALDSNDQYVQYNGKKYRPSELALRLESKVHDYENGKSVIKTQEQVLASKRQALELGRERISAMRDQKELLELRVTVAKLEARLEAGQVKPDATVEVDAARLRRFRELAEKLDGQFAEVEQIFELPKQADRQQKSIDEVIQAAKKALQPDENKNKPADK